MSASPAVAGETSRFYAATQWQLMWRKFLRHRLAVLGLIILTIFYTIAAFAEFIAPYDPYRRNTRFIHVPPQKIRFAGQDGFSLRPFVYGLKQELDPVTWRRRYVEDPSQRYYLRFFTRGDRYRLWGLIETDWHLFGVDGGGTLFLMGTDGSGRDLFSRIIYGTRVSLTVGLVGILISFVLGCLLGGISGYYGGTADLLIQRVIEFLLSIPTIPLWMALAAAMPKNWSTLQVYFAITIILSVVGWSNLARVVRGKLLELREEDFVLAAKLAGASDLNIILSHLLPGLMSYLVVSVTLAIPGMILGETALSFLGIGLRPPVISWGVLLNDAQSVSAIALHPWLLWPGLFVVLAVLAFNFVGDGLRDAADPYQ